MLGVHNTESVFDSIQKGQCVCWIYCFGGNYKFFGKFDSNKRVSDYGGYYRHFAFGRIGCVCANI